MKSVIFATIMLSTSFGYTQTNWTFQWHDQTMGLQFEVTNLTANVKRAIRDDVAYSLSLIPTTNVVFEVYPPTHPDYGKHTGFAHFSSARINYCEGVLFFYKTVGGNVYWEIDTDASTEYLAAIALTNQHSTAMASFTNFHHNLLTGFDVTGLTLAEKKAFFWGPYLDRIEQEMGVEFEPSITETLSWRPSPLPEWTFPPKPSILAFSKWKEVGAEEIDALPKPDLACIMKHWTPDGKRTKWSVVYVGGKWRYCLMDL